MNQAQLEDLLHWLADNTDCYWERCDESAHMYFGDQLECIGGWAGDERRFFLNDTKKANELIEQYKQSGEAL